MDNLRYGSEGGERIKYSVDFNGIDKTESMNHKLVFRVGKIKPASTPSSRTPTNKMANMSTTDNPVKSDISNIEIAIDTNLHTFTSDDRFQRFILDIQKDGKAGGMSGGDMIAIMKDVLGCDIDMKTDIDELIDKLENTYPQQSPVITRTPKPKWDERDETGLYKMCVTPARLLVLETGALSKFATFKIFEKGAWQACNAFKDKEYNGWWDGTQNFFDILADGYAFQGKTFATIMDPASPIQSPMFPAIHFDMNEEWFRVVYGIPDTSPVRIQLMQDIPTPNELDAARRELGLTSTHTVPDGASRVTYSVTASSDASDTVNALVYSSIPNICQPTWKETSRQELGSLSKFLQGNAENGKLYQTYLSHKNKSNKSNKLKVLQCMIGKENGDCCQVYALISNVIVMAAHMASAPGSDKTASEYFKDIMKSTNMVTCDRVVYLQCMALNVPCTYHGAGNGEVKVFNPYNATPLTPKEQLAQMKNKVSMTADDTIRNIERYRQSLAKALASGLSVLRYRDPDTAVKPFPRNCFDELKTRIDTKIEELYTTIDSVIKLKESVNQEQETETEESQRLSEESLRLSEISRHIDEIHANPSYKCVETTTEYSKIARVNNRIFVLNESVVGKDVFDEWIAKEKESGRTRGLRGNHGGGRKPRTRTTQTGGVLPSSEDKFERELEYNPKTIMEYYHSISNTVIDSHRSKLQNKLDEIDRQIQTEQSMSPQRAPTPRQTPTPRPIQEEAQEALRFERDTLLKEMKRVDRLVEVIQEIDQEKENYWKTRNEIISSLRDSSENIFLYENTILNTTDIETLSTVFACLPYENKNDIPGLILTLKNYFITPNESGTDVNPLSFHSTSEYAPIIHEKFNDIKGNPPTPEHVKLLLYGETTTTTGIDENSRVSLLCLLYLILNEVILDMVPLYVFSTSDEGRKDLYTRLYHSQSPSQPRSGVASHPRSEVFSQSVYAESQPRIDLSRSQEPPRTPPYMFDESQMSLYPVTVQRPSTGRIRDDYDIRLKMDESQDSLLSQLYTDADMDGGGSARKSLTRRRRNHRKTVENTRKKKRSSYTNAKKSNKKRSSYRKHQNTIKKRRKNRRVSQ